MSKIDISALDQTSQDKIADLVSSSKIESILMFQATLDYQIAILDSELDSIWAFACDCADQLGIDQNQFYRQVFWGMDTEV